MARVRTFAEEVVGKAVGGDFIVVELTKDVIKPVYDDGGQLITFKTGSEANAYAERRSRDSGTKCQVRRVQNDDWRKREEARFADGTYTSLPWHDQPWWIDLKKHWGDHFPHVSIEKGAYVAFTEDAQKGAADIQTRIKPGRYLERYFGENKTLSSYVIRDLCTIFSKKFEDNRLLWATTPEEIVEVYTNGPSSCMSKAVTEYKSGEHPTGAYGAGDIHVAYLYRDGRIVARTLTFPEKKVYSPHFYGDRGRLEPLLKKEGFREGLPFGARLLKKEKKSGSARQFVAPFVDGVGWVRVDGDYLRIGDKGNMDDIYGLKVDGTSGLTEAFGFKCSHCDNSGELPLRNMRTVISVGPMGKDMETCWCVKCDKVHAIVCPMTGLHCAPDATIEIRQQGRTQRVSRRMMRNSFVCQGSGIRHVVDEMVQLADGRVWSGEYFKTHGKYCDQCGGAYERKVQCPSCDRRKGFKMLGEQSRWS